MASNDDGGPEQAHAVGWQMFTKTMASIRRNAARHSGDAVSVSPVAFCRSSRIGKITEASDVPGMK